MINVIKVVECLVGLLETDNDFDYFFNSCDYSNVKVCGHTGFISSSYNLRDFCFICEKKFHSICYKKINEYLKSDDSSALLELVYGIKTLLFISTLINEIIKSDKINNFTCDNRPMKITGAEWNDGSYIVITFKYTDAIREFRDIALDISPSIWYNGPFTNWEDFCNKASISFIDFDSSKSIVDSADVINNLLYSIQDFISNT